MFFWSGPSEICCIVLKVHTLLAPLRVPLIIVSLMLQACHQLFLIFINCRHLCMMRRLNLGKCLWCEGRPTLAHVAAICPRHVHLPLLGASRLGSRTLRKLLATFLPRTPSTRAHPRRVHHGACLELERSLGPLARRPLLRGKVNIFSSRERSSAWSLDHTPTRRRRANPRGVDQLFWASLGKSASLQIAVADIALQRRGSGALHSSTASIPGNTVGGGIAVVPAFLRDVRISTSPLEVVIGLICCGDDPVDASAERDGTSAVAMSAGSCRSRLSSQQHAHRRTPTTSPTASCASVW